MNTMATGSRSGTGGSTDSSPLICKLLTGRVTGPIMGRNLKMVSFLRRKLEKEGRDIFVNIQNKANACGKLSDILSQN